MRSRGRRNGLLMVGVLCAVFGAVGCSGGDKGSGPTGPSTSGNGDGGSNRCVDEDGDGAGDNCDVRDCDDEDPSITDECIRCREPNEGCPCEPGTPPTFCEPPDVEINGQVFECQEGTRYCREEADDITLWTDCEVIGMYTLKE